MSDLNKALSDVDFNILKNADKEIYESYTAGQRSLKLNPNNDIDYILQLNKSFFAYYINLINSLPEADQPLEKLKCKLIQEQIESAIKSLSFNKNILDKNRFLFYNIAYVNDIIKRNCSPNDKV